MYLCSEKASAYPTALLSDIWNLVTTEDDESKIATGQDRPVKGLQELIQRAVDDPDFRRRLLADPEEVIRVEGYKVDSEIIAKLKKAGEVPSYIIDAAVEKIRKDEGRAG